MTQSLPSIQELQKAVDFNSAYMVEDYPYGFTLRTRIKYWIETAKNKGMRSVSCTLNPKTGNWNKPKVSSYYDFLYLYFNEKGHVANGGGHYASVDEMIKLATHIKEKGLVINPGVDEHLRYKFAALVKIEYGWGAKKYSEATRPAYKENAQQRIAMIVKADSFLKVLELPAVPVPDLEKEEA